MAITPLILWPEQSLVTAPLPLFTALTVTLISKVVFTNVSANTQTISVYVVSSGARPITPNLIISAYTLQSNQAYVSAELAGIMLNRGDAIYASASSGIAVNTIGNGYAFS